VLRIGYKQCTDKKYKGKQYRQSTYNVTLKRVRETIVAVENQEIITYSECIFVGLGTQHAMHMRHIVICGLPGCAVFFHMSHQRHDFLKNVIEHKMFVFSSQLLSDTV